MKANLLFAECIHAHRKRNKTRCPQSAGNAELEKRKRQSPATSDGVHGPTTEE
ncbi:MAG: hypothetical protein KJ950_07420 [Proteobacteria bacterium]|nr:hypothetical protein [Pseudomonadota bacterium]MBU1687074.1 hypothetical protein [Pseudomonadota bacterium]